MNLKGKTALVTGSTSGIGLTVARSLAQRGAHIVINGLGDAQDIEAQRAAIESDFRVRCSYSDADMTQPAQIRSMVEQAIEMHGAVDILINNAGIQFVSPIDEFPEERFNAIIAINLVSAFHTIKAALPGMKRKRWGRIINIASAHALVASPFKSAYVAAKHGVAGLTKTVALEVATEGITVNAVCPGYVWTPLVERQIPDTMKSRGMTEQEVKEKVLLAAQPTRRFVTMDEVAGVCGYLVSESAASMTGAILTVDGGWTAQ